MSDPTFIPVVGWEMTRDDGRGYRYLIAGEYYTRGTITDGVWSYITFTLSPEHGRESAVSETEHDEENGYLLNAGPSWASDLVYEEWLVGQTRLPHMDSGTMDSVFDTLLMHGEAA